MLFNSITYALFLPLVFLLYWFVFNRNILIRNIFIIAVSYFFYSCWDWRFLFLIIISSLTDFFIGLGLTGKHNSIYFRKMLLVISIIVNIGLLGFFKYFNFFITSLVDGFANIGIQLNVSTLNIILPVGISFYTFQTLSYTIDIYNRKIEATKNITAFLAFVGFFPQLVAGPIERANRLLPQFLRKHEFSYEGAIDGLRQILWGLTKKIVIADNCSYFVNEIFGNYTNHSPVILVLGAFLFAFQVYGDFSGYSDIAIGSARLLGFDLMKNFDFPFFSRNISELWRRWHISMSSWFRDYMYIPMLKGKHNKSHRIKSTIIVFTISGLWHGANWNFILWGLIQGIYFIPRIIFKRKKINTPVVAYGKIFPRLSELLQMAVTFTLFSFSLIVFRSNDIRSAIGYFSGILHDKAGSGFRIPEILFSTTTLFIIGMMLIEWVQRTREHALDLSNHKIPVVIRWMIYFLFVALILIYGGNQQEFFYFQF